MKVFENIDNPKMLIASADMYIHEEEDFWYLKDKRMNLDKKKWRVKEYDNNKKNPRKMRRDPS